MDTFFAIFEFVVNLSEPLLLLYLLANKLPLKRRALPLAIAGVVLLALVTTYSNSKGLEYVATTFITLSLHCVFALVFFGGDYRLRIACASLMTFVIIFSNTLLFEINTAIPFLSVIATLRPTFMRIAVLIAYMLLNFLLVRLVLRFTKDMDTVYTKKVSGLLFAGFLCIAVMYLLLEITQSAVEAGLNTVRHGVISLLLLILAAFLLALFSSSNKWAKLFAAEQLRAENLKREIDYNKEVEGINRSVRQLKHDYANHMSVIADLSEKGEICELQKYMKEYESEYGAIDRYAITGDNSLDSLLSYKKMICDADDIDLSISAGCDNIDKTGISSLELSSLFGNLIDNAINASRMIEPDKRKIDLSIKRKADMFSICIVNNRALDAPEEPADGRIGLGLPRIRSIVESHNGIIEIMPDKGNYTVEILLPITDEEI